MKKIITAALIGVISAVVTDAAGNDGVKIANGILNIISGTAKALSQPASNNRQTRNGQPVATRQNDPAAASPYTIPEGSYVPPAAVQWKNTSAAGTEQAPAAVPGQAPAAAPGQAPAAAPGQAPAQSGKPSAGAEEQTETFAPAKTPWQK